MHLSTWGLEYQARANSGQHMAGIAIGGQLAGGSVMTAVQCLEQKLPPLAIAPCAVRSDHKHFQ